MSAIARAEGGTERRSAPALTIRAAAGFTALAAVVCGSWWIAAGAADGRRWLELPTGANPAWIDGPLHELAGTAGSLPAPALSAALIMLAVGYLAAIACATAIPLRIALVAVALAALAFTLGPTLVSTDVFGYIAYARETALHGLNPYLSAPASTPHDSILQFVYWKHQASPYGPLFTLLSVPLGLISPSVALWIYKALAGLAAVALAALTADVARARGADPRRAAILVGLNPVLLVYAVSGAHNDLLAALLIACAVALMVRRRETAAGGAALAAAAIKLTLGLALPFILIGARRRRAATGGAALALVALAVPTLLLFGTHFFDQLHRIASNPLFDTAWSGPDRLATLIGTRIDGLVRGLGTGAAATVAIWMLVRAWRGGDAIVACGWAFVALIASIASLAPWYLVWLLPLAAFGTSRTLAAAALLATLYLLAVHLPAFGGHLWLTEPKGQSAALLARGDQMWTYRQTTRSYSSR